MNIYSYINSKDVREHLQNMEYHFTALEAAFIVYHSTQISLLEKIEVRNGIQLRSGKDHQIS